MAGGHSFPAAMPQAATTRAANQHHVSLRRNDSTMRRRRAARTCRLSVSTAIHLRAIPVLIRRDLSPGHYSRLLEARTTGRVRQLKPGSRTSLGTTRRVAESPGMDRVSIDFALEIE